ncbi:helix-turn-helix domain-containing protein [Amycolatopsis sp. K13G38]|uniref:Helix-turn-helix domain-containing protein n=1 Tax=Amycolatopsis acididurans TaxID=2724524 RepID=A0ABX1IUZ6_9PSEU|nr:helix-turn-helix domain-containing protein [Amycolatopsis acididurans]NKQ51317.1 helix-turn-helix domain-containing protein [Amycolatopsis acididurans]
MVHLAVHTTRSVSEAESLDYWRHVISEAFVPLDATAERDRFQGQVCIDQLGAMVVSRVDAQPHRVRRTKAMIARRERGYYKLGLQLRGGCLLVQDGREAILRPGDFALYDTDRPYTLAFEDTTSMAVFMFPRERLRLGATSAQHVLGRRIEAEDETGSLLSPLFRRLARRLEGGNPASTMPLADAVLDLLSALLTEQVTDAAPADQSHAALVLRAKAFVDENLADPGLCPDVVAAALHISTRYLQKLFAGEGTGVAGWIRARRLEQCRRDLARPGRTVSAVGAAWGLPDAAHFSRTFKAAYGMSPREYANRQQGFA